MGEGLKCHEGAISLYFGGGKVKEISLFKNEFTGMVAMSGVKSYF